MGCTRARGRTISPAPDVEKVEERIPIFPGEATMTKKPNIIFLLSDQHRHGVLGCAGDKATASYV